MGKIIFNIGQGGLGRALPGKDYYSGLLFDSPTYPAGFSAGEPIKQVGSLQEAEALGIIAGVGETVATGGLVDITAAGAAGDTYVVDIKSTRNPSIELASVIESAAETITTMAAKIAAAINLGTTTHGFSATSALGVVTLIMAPDWGAAFNGAGLSCTISGAGTSTVTQFTAGVGSDMSALHYTVSEFFRLQAKGVLYIGVYDESGGLSGDDIKDIQAFSGGDIRQMAVLLQSAYSSADLAVIQTAIEELQVDYQYMNGLYGADQLSDTITAIPDLRALTNDRTSAILAMDGGGEGWRLVDVLDRSLPAIGACLGTVALAQVNESIGWVAKFDIAGVDLDTLAFTTGDLYTAISQATQTVIENKGWVFAQKLQGKGGSYWVDDPTAESTISDYAQIRDGRTIDKAIRVTNAGLSDFINAPLFVDPDTGQLTELTISEFKNAASTQLEQMVIDLELSGYEVIIDPNQDVLATSEIVLTINLLPVGAARTIIVNIGYVVSLA